MQCMIRSAKLEETILEGVIDQLVRGCGSFPHADGRGPHHLRSHVEGNMEI